MKILSKLKSLLAPKPKAEVTPAKAKLPRKKKKSATRIIDPAHDPLTLIKSAVKEYGSSGLTVKNLLQTFGHQKKLPQYIEKINEAFKENSLYCIPSLTTDIDPKQRVHIYSFPVKRSTDFFEKETMLEDWMKKRNLYTEPPFNLTLLGNQNRPKESRDRMDFICTDKAGSTVVIELKRAGGGKSAVEQVLRYIGMVKQGKPEHPVRGILITGVKDIHTAKAIYGMTDDQRKAFEWYLYDYNDNTKQLTFEPISISEIVSHFDNPIA